MVNFRHFDGNDVKGIQQIGYRPPDGYTLDLEVFSASELRYRIDTARFHAAHRIEFYQLIYITHGTCIHTVDFHPLQCGAGTILMLRPAQAQQFDVRSDWDGWVVIFRPEFLLPLHNASNIADVKLAVDLDALPDELSVDLEQSKHLNTIISQMHTDTLMQAPSVDLHNLLRHQLYALLLRLQIVHGHNKPKDKHVIANVARFQYFKQLVEKNFAKWHLVSDYATDMGCSEKSLNRAVREVSGSATKSFITSRVNLEAKRLLAHTAMPIRLISDRVGFDETTNFVKFFKREVGCSPGDFRRQYKEVCNRNSIGQASL
jgi:AraC-like DNA-binding protein